MSQPSHPAPPPLPYTDKAPPSFVGRRNGLGAAALIVALLAVLSCWTVVGGIVFGVLAVALGVAGRARVRRREADNNGVAIAGVVLGVLAAIAGVAFIPIWITAGIGDYYHCMNTAGKDRAAQQRCADGFTGHVQTQLSPRIPTGAPSWVASAYAR